MDIIIVLVLLIIIALVFKIIYNTIIAFGLIDVFLRIVYFIGNNTTQGIREFTRKYFPASIEAILRGHSTGALETILVWIYVILMAMFWYFVLRMLIRRIK